jgi:serine/threonine protein phosphatase PrpC
MTEAPLKYIWATATHVGHVRSGNEDAVSPDSDGAGTGPLLVAVADGMGGHVGGEVASRLAIEAAAGAPAAADTEPRSRVEAGNEAVVDASRENPELAGMGTTLTLAIFGDNGRMRIGHVGDSRLYLLRDGNLQQVTMDHTWVTEMQRRGQLSPEQAANHPRKHLLTRVLGMSHVEIDETEIPLEDGDRVLVCSDGLTTMLDDDAVGVILSDADTPSDAAWALVEAANAAGGYDNTTVAVVDVTA